MGFEVAGGVVEVSGGVEWVGGACFEGDGCRWCDAHGSFWFSFVGFLGWGHIVGLLVGVAGDGVCCGCGVFWFVGEGTGVGFAGCGFEGDGALGGAVGVGGFGAAVGDLAVVDEVFVGGGGGVAAAGKEGEGEEEGGECGFGVHGFVLSVVFGCSHYTIFLVWYKTGGGVKMFTVWWFHTMGRSMVQLVCWEQTTQSQKNSQEQRNPYDNPIHSF